MPKIKISHIVSFSSEDPVHCANNLLSNDTSKKWKCLNPGEKSTSVVLQLEKASVISGIDIGNEHSAYVEVLAGRSSASDDFKVLLVMSSFMTPSESKQSINPNKVRMFTKHELQDPECNEKWDRIKIICTQPFNRHVQYGLSFITLHAPEEKEENFSGSLTLGKFHLRPASPDNLNAGSLFAKRKELMDDNPLTGAAAIRKASSLALSGSPVSKPKLDLPTTPKNKATFEGAESSVSKERNRKEILYEKDDEEPNEKIDKLIEKKNKELAEKKQQEDKKKLKAESTPRKRERKKNSDHLDIKKNSTTPSTSKQSPTENKRKMESKDRSNKKIKTNIQRKPFNRLLEGVVLVISGIQHPERGLIRSKALEMGSKYKSDWDNSCTHLVCAFPNTPKFNQVKGKGRIVTKDWVFDCYNQRKRLPWRRYALDKKDLDKSVSEDEIWELQDEPEDRSESESVASEKIADSGSDTEDEIQRIQASQQKKKVPSKESKRKKEKEKMKDDPDPYLVDTEEEQISKQNGEIVKPKLANFFENYIFYIDDEIMGTERKELEKYIVAYNGSLVNHPSEVVDLVITDKEKGNSFSEACPDAKIVDFNWIWDCHNQQKFIEIDKFEI